MSRTQETQSAAGKLDETDPLFAYLQREEVGTTPLGLSSSSIGFFVCLFVVNLNYMLGSDSASSSFFFFFFFFFLFFGPLHGL